MGLVARDLMQPKVNTIREKATLVDLDRKLIEKKQSGFPVVDETGRLVGVVSRSDVVRKLATEQSLAEYSTDYYSDLSEGTVSIEFLSNQVGQRLEDATVADVMTSDPVTVTSDTSLRDLTMLMNEKRIHRVPVVDDGELVGIVSSMDVVRVVAEGKV